MEIFVDRIVSDKQTTISSISVDRYFHCFGLEDEFRTVKVPGETRIPSGTYQVGVRSFGGIHERYAVRFKDIHMGMLEILEVPGFTHVLIHCGNTEKHTDGCLLVGQQANTIPGQMRIANSSLAYKRFYLHVIPKALAGDLTIKFGGDYESYVGGC